MPVRHPIARVFSKDKIVESRPLNWAGVQPFRTFAARAVYICRPRHQAAIPQLAQSLRTQGIVTIPDFLDPDELSLVRDEYADVVATNANITNEIWQGTDHIETANILSLDARRVQATRRFLGHPKLKALFEAAERRPINMLSGPRLYERLTQGAEDGARDPETVLHIDTYFNTHKAWLYLSDVTLDDGPFVYVPGSHRLDVHRLVGDYLGSLKPATDYAGSRRIAAKELVARGLEEKVYICPANTLVIANTTGYHRRLKGRAGNVRKAVQLTCRSNPFRP